MSFANTTSKSEWSVNPEKAYISTDNFAGAFYTYTVSTSGSQETIGTLTTVATSANANVASASSLFARGHHLLLNGRKLIPGVNPMNAITRSATSTNNPFISGSSPGATTVTLSPSGASATTTTSASSTFAPKFMVGVMDIQTGLNGFIDPTNALFVLYDKNRPVSHYLTDMAAGLTAANARALVNSGQNASSKGTSIAIGPLPTGTGNAATPLGAATFGSITMTTFQPSGTTGTTNSTYTFTSTAITSTTVVILTLTASLKTPINNSTTQFYVIVAPGQFTITIENSGTAQNITPGFNFLILN